MVDSMYSLYGVQLGQDHAPLFLHTFPVLLFTTKIY